MKSAEFSETSYCQILDLAAAKYLFNGSNITTNNPVVCWRHDVDYSPQRALSLAKFECERGLRCVYHILCSSRYYNILEPEISEILKEVSSLGHEIGLHFDMDVFLNQTVSKEEVLNRIDFEKKLLETITQTEIISFSFHNHVLHHTNLINEKYICGMLNLASSKFYEPAKYLSDSNGIWRHESLTSLIEGPLHSKLHVLTHPVWWTAENISPFHKVNRAVDGRAQANKNIYLHTMKRDGRLLSIGKKIGVTDQDLVQAGLSAYNKG